MRNKVNDIPDGATHKDSFGDFYMLGENGSWMFYHIENGWEGWYDDSIVRGQLTKLGE